jgi:hypothetical protein
MDLRLQTCFPHATTAMFLAESPVSTPVKSRSRKVAHIR